MSRLLSVIGLAVLAGFGVAACHTSGPPGSDPGDMGGMNDPKMHRVIPPVTACNAQSSPPTCSPVEALR
jgi:hypothetical protein